MSKRKYKIIDIKNSKLKVQNTFIPDDFDEHCWEGIGIYSDNEFSEDTYYYHDEKGITDKHIPYTGKGRDSEGKRILSDEIVIKMENFKKPENHYGHMEHYYSSIPIEIYPTELKKDDMDFLVNQNNNLKIKEKVNYVLNEQFNEYLFYAPQILHRVLTGGGGHEFYILVEKDKLGISPGEWDAYDNDPSYVTFQPQENHTHMNYYLRFRVDFHPILKIISFTFSENVGGHRIRQGVSLEGGLDKSWMPVTFQFKKDSTDVMIFLYNMMKILNMENHQFSAVATGNRKFEISLTKDENCFMIDRENFKEVLFFDPHRFCIDKRAFLELNSRILQVIKLYNLK